VLPPPLQPTTATTLRARTRAQKIRFIVNSMKRGRVWKLWRRQRALE
jgi:hypothetical protein